MLAAAAQVLRDADAEAARTVTMDAVARAAGVGKGTVFRAFGDRDGLLEALAEAEFRTVRARVEQLGDEVGAADQVVALLEAVLGFKLASINLMRAREAGAGGDPRSERYRWTHARLQELLRRAAPDMFDGEASYTAHALLAALQVNLLDRLLAEGLTPAEISRLQARRARCAVRGCR